MRSIAIDSRGTHAAEQGIPWKSHVPAITPRIGPFTRLDYAQGKVRAGAPRLRAPGDVGTLTVVLKGSAIYADRSAEQRLEAGAVAWSPSGEGVLAGGDGGGRVTAVQLQVAARGEAGVCREAPRTEADGVSIRVFAGHHEALVSPLPDLPLVMEVDLKPKAVVQLEAVPDKRVFALVWAGELVAPEGIAPGHQGTCWVFHPNGNQVQLQAAGRRTRVIVGIGRR